ncbi:bifunctional phosphopantothenoylcysteine decarboxylase/phosphopantothenate--cysteine ligase CoaBC [Methanolacinia petrolearia]|uniref:bifunctional phosphopantothenoylcysteine decarboxylase/phosphopantothenate--cysteine ligase CoaBC n=1 Tax=Methanolacinia petrolearia TaxID=54120 RepID=UPI003BA95F69
MKEKLQTLENKTIVLGVTGSIAAVEVIKLARELRRMGASVRGVMSKAACGIIHPDALTYACDFPAITSISGMIEHVKYCGIGGEADLLLIAPATANTICKIAAGIDDTPVTTFATTAIGRGMPVVVVPAMHESMYNHPAVRDAIAKLEGWNITVLSPLMEENKAKIPSMQEIVLTVERELSEKPLAGERVLITSGACVEEIDDVRVMTTRSSGAMGREMALAAFRLGADVTVVHGGEEIPLVRNIGIRSASEMREVILENENPGYYVSAAAISDFAPEKFEGKIPSGTPTAISLKTLPKLVDEVLKNPGTKVIAFKLGWNEMEKAREMIGSGVALVAVNTPESMGGETGSYTLVTSGGESSVEGRKEDIAAAIWKEIGKL